MSGSDKPAHQHSLAAEGYEQREKAYRRLGGSELLPFTYSNPFSWPTEWRWAAGGFLGPLSLSFFFNRYYRRPFYAQLMPNLAISTASAVIGVVMSRLRDQHFAFKDAVIHHYVETHPQDFARMKPENQRRYNEILLPWYPIRAQYTGKPRPSLPPKMKSEDAGDDE